MKEVAITVAHRFLLGLLLGACLFILIGCEDRFRYPCQDPKNWDKEECKRPLCSVTQTCPDQLTKPEEMKGDAR